MSPVPTVTKQSQFDALGAGPLLVAVLALCLGAGALIGWAAGSVGYGIVVGTVVGVPAGIFAVYRRYRGYFAG